MHRFPLKHHLEDTYGVPAKLVPDANLLAHGLFQFGEGRQFDSFVAIGLGTGTAVSLVSCGDVLTDPKGFPRRGHAFLHELGWPGAWMHSGHHFANYYGIDPKTAYRRACASDSAALDVWQQVGEALGETIIRLASETDIPTAVIARGLSAAWSFIAPSALRQVQAKSIRVIRTGLPHPSLSGAAGLFLRVSQ